VFKSPVLYALVVGSVLAVSARLDSRASIHSLAGAWTLNPSGTAEAQRETNRSLLKTDTSRFGVDSARLGRARDAWRAITDTPEHLRIVETESIVIVTASNGHTIRMAPGLGPIKDESTGVRRRTRWNGDMLVSEITGLLPGKIVETHSVDASHRLHVVIKFPALWRAASFTTHRVYDPAGQP
jgi:hypothetical protein